MDINRGIRIMSTSKHRTPLVPCQHIADYYRSRWEAHKCLAWNLLRIGYSQHAQGRASDPANNLYEESQI